MGRASPVLQPRRAASPSPFQQSRSLPRNPQQQPDDPGKRRSGYSAPRERRIQPASAFRRAVSGEGMPQRDPELDDSGVVAMEAENAVRSGRVEKGSPRRLRYDNVSRSEDHAGLRAAMISPMRRSRSKQQAAEEKSIGDHEIVDVPIVGYLRSSCSSPTALKALERSLSPDLVKVSNGSSQLKQKAAEIMASWPAFSFSGRSSAQTPRSSEQNNKRSDRVYADQTQKDDWLQLITDLVMWRDFSRSSLMFGAGAFSILSASFMRDIHVNVVTVVSYLALIYLSAKFFSKNFLRRSPSDSWKLNEAAALELTKELLPALNSVLLRLSQLFSGDPATTLQMAGVLWFLAHAGYWMSFWTMFRLAYFGAFLIPRGYVAYSTQLHEQVVPYFWSVWDGCSHKKVVILTLLVCLWNLTTASARLWFAFFGLVTFRHYHESFGSAMINPVAENSAPMLVMVKKEQ